LQDKTDFLFEKFYYIQYKEGKREANPYYPKCYDQSGRKAHLLPLDLAGKWSCSIYNIIIFDDDFKSTPSGQKFWTEE
jgi:hypothetical protein